MYNMFSLKRGATLVMTEEIEKILNVFCPIYKLFKLPVIITSGNDGKHGAKNSLHYSNKAIDIRKNFPESDYAETWKLHGKDILKSIEMRRADLAYPIQTIDETDHIHTEWDEKAFK